MLFGLIKPRLAMCASRLQTEGATGDDISAFQRHLNRRARSYEVQVAVTGIYDAATREAVRDYQRRVLSIRSADGFVGPQTARKLRITLLDDPCDGK